MNLHWLDSCPAFFMLAHLKDSNFILFFTFFNHGLCQYGICDGDLLDHEVKKDPWSHKIHYTKEERKIYILDEKKENELKFRDDLLWKPLFTFVPLSHNKFSFFSCLPLFHVFLPPASMKKDEKITHSSPHTILFKKVHYVSPSWNNICWLTYYKMTDADF